MFESLAKKIGQLFGRRPALGSTGGRGRLNPLYVAAPVAGLATALAVIAVAGGSGNGGSPNTAALRTATPSGAAATATAAARNTAIAADLGGSPSRAQTSGTPGAAASPTQAAAPTATSLPDRSNCDEIRGTDYRSDSERLWFQTFCTGSGNTAAAQSPSPAGGQTGAQQQPGAATPPPGSTTQPSGGATQPAGGATNTPPAGATTAPSPTSPAGGATSTPVPPTATNPPATATTPPQPTPTPSGPATASLSPSSVKLGSASSITFTGTLRNFPPNTELTARYTYSCSIPGCSGSGTLSETVTTDASGGASASYTVTGIPTQTQICAAARLNPEYRQYLGTSGTVTVTFSGGGKQASASLSISLPTKAECNIS